MSPLYFPPPHHKALDVSRTASSPIALNLLWLLQSPSHNFLWIIIRIMILLRKTFRIGFTDDILLRSVVDFEHVKTIRRPQ